MTKPAQISPKDQEILSYIVAFKRAHDGNSPSIRQIGDACGVLSTSTVNYHLRRLEKSGAIEYAGEPGEPRMRMIRVIGGCWLPPAHLVNKITAKELKKQDAERLLEVVLPR